MFLRGKSYAVLGIAFFSMLIRFPFDLKQFHNVDEGVIGTLANIILRGGLSTGMAGATADHCSIIHTQGYLLYSAIITWLPSIL